MDSSIGSDTTSSTCDDLPVNLDTLALDDGTTPKQGDQVEVQVTGTVSQIVNGMAKVTPKLINGQPIPEETQEESATPDDDMMSQAMAYDQNQGY